MAEHSPRGNVRITRRANLTGQSLAGEMTPRKRTAEDGVSLSMLSMGTVSISEQCENDRIDSNSPDSRVTSYEHALQITQVMVRDAVSDNCFPVVTAANYQSCCLASAAAANYQCCCLPNIAAAWPVLLLTCYRCCLPTAAVTAAWPVLLLLVHSLLLFVPPQPSSHSTYEHTTAVLKLRAHHCCSLSLFAVT